MMDDKVRALLGVNQFWLEAVIGAAILGTVMFYSLLARGAERAESASRRPSLIRPPDLSTER
jgi:ribose/xylose/arabinose/galactoside ABC-type transport system permease subunit